MSAGPALSPELRPLGPIPEDAAGAEADALLVAKTVREAGGRALIVGGYVRDRMLLGESGGEPDLEVFGLPAPRLERALRRLGRVRRVGRSFPVLRIGGLSVEVALPRRESKVAPGHRGFEVAADPQMSFVEAARRRDLSLNAMGLDPLTGELLDPYRGREALAAGQMRATDAAKFPEDPLRGLRVAAFASRFGFEADDALKRLCSELDLSELSAERILDELEKALLGPRPALAFGFLAETGLLRHFPELDALRGSPAPGGGDAFEATLGALEAAAGAVTSGPEEVRALRFAALCRDFGRPAAVGERPPERESAFAPDSRAAAGAALAEAFLDRLRAPKALTAEVAALVLHQSAPNDYPRDRAPRSAYRRLARELGEAGTTAERLLRLAEAARRAEPAAAGREFPEGAAFREGALAAGVFRGPPEDAVNGKRVLARGIRPGKVVGRILASCRELQDETGESDPDRLLDRVLRDLPTAPAPTREDP